MILLFKQITGNRTDWILKDFVRNCGEDIKLDIVPDSVKVNKHFLMMWEPFYFPAK